MPPQKYTILLVEDNDADAGLLRATLWEIPDALFEVVHVQRLGKAVEMSRTTHFDLMLLDLTLPDSSGMETVSRAHALVPNSLPIVVTTGLDDESVAMEAVRIGAQDYLIKGQTDSRLLHRAVRYSIERKRVEMELRKVQEELEERVRQRTTELEQAVTVLGDEALTRERTEKALRDSEARFRQMCEALPEVCWMTAPDLSEVYFVNSAYERLWGRSRQSLYDDPLSWLAGVHADDRQKLKSLVLDWLETLSGTQQDSIAVRYRVVRPDGSVSNVSARAFAIRDDRGALMQICGVIEDVRRP